MVKKKIYVYSTEYMNDEGEKDTVEVRTFGAFPRKQDVEKAAGKKVRRINSATCIIIHSVEMSADDFLTFGVTVDTEM